MPLTFAKPGEANVIKKVGGREKTRLFLEKLGFVEGSIVTVVAEYGQQDTCIGTITCI